MNIHETQNRAIDPVLDAPIRPDAQRIPAPLPILHFALDRRDRVDTLGDQLLESGGSEEGVENKDAIVADYESCIPGSQSAGLVNRCIDSIGDFDQGEIIFGLGWRLFPTSIMPSFFDCAAWTFPGIR